MSGQKIAFGVLILIAILFAAGLLVGSSTSSADPASAPWVAHLQTFLPSPRSVTAAEITGSCIQGATVMVGVNMTCNIAIAGNGPALRSLNLSLPQPPNPAATEDIDLSVTPNDAGAVAMKALLRAANTSEHSADLKIQAGGANVAITCKTAVRGICSVAVP
jgi:hypothetical protein